METLGEMEKLQLQAWDYEYRMQEIRIAANRIGLASIDAAIGGGLPPVMQNTPAHASLIKSLSHEDPMASMKWEVYMMERHARSCTEVGCPVHSVLDTFRSVLEGAVQ